MKKRMSLFLAILMALAVFMTACGGSSNTAQPADTSADKAATDTAATDKAADEAKPEEAAPAPAKDEKITLSFIDYVPSAARETYYEKMMELYNQENPNIVVEYGSVPYEEANNKLTQMGAAQDLPDIVNLHGALKLQFVPSGWLAQLDKYLDAEPGYKDSFVAAVRDILWADETAGLGGIYTMPDGIMTNGIFIRKDWVEEAGLKLDDLMSNWTWETYMDTVYKLTDPDKGRYGISYRGGSAAFDRLEQYLVAYTDSYDFDDEGNCLLYTPENVERVQKFLNMYLDGCGPKDSINWGFAEMVDNFTGGLTGTLNNDVEVVATCLERMEDSQWAVMPLPRSSVDGRINSYAGPAYGYAVSSFSEYQDEAWGFIELLMRPENNAEFCKLFTNMPVRSEVDDPFFGPDGPVYGFMKQLDDPNFCAYSSYGTYLDLAAFRTDAHVGWQKVLMGNQTVDAQLKLVDDQLTEIAKQWLADNPGKQLGQARIGGKIVPYKGPSGAN